MVSDFERDDLHREISRSQGKLTSCYDLDPMGESNNKLPHYLNKKNKNKLLIASGPVKRSYQYDKVGNLTRMSDNRGSNLHYFYDKGVLPKQGKSYLRLIQRIILLMRKKTANQNQSNK
ncbi:hypothetical protein [Zophobihabitans entericus]|uniref:YD repeat-containing protein n=1 Tax=Zophobihabitans entericus TaxID=1635327 RepID=A0A6G9IB22_9GAMM|nr:hypothetical protein [Zophobihabitans entericus]QIQ21426.1 hypothetical protein IPMB12_06830 [Zophobihabitans entericus]